MSEDDLKGLTLDKTQKIMGPQRRRKTLGFVVALVLVLAVAAGLYWGGVISPAVTVDVTTVSLVYPAQSLSFLNASGYVVAQRKAAVASKTTGRLTALLVAEGHRIKRGQIIARMENEDVTAGRNQAAANLNSARAALAQAGAERAYARTEYERYRSLLAQGFVSRSEFDLLETRYQKTRDGFAAAEAGVDAANAALRNAEASLAYTLIRAPFDAVVLTKNADVGDIVTPIGAAANAKAAVVTIADMDSLQVEVDVSETSIAKIQVGQPCDIQLDALPDLRFPGEVDAIVPTVDRSKATVLVKVRFLERDHRMLPDMSAKAAFLSRPLGREERRPRLALHQGALRRSGGKTEVFRLQGKEVAKTEIQTGAGLGEMIEVLSGVASGDRVVLSPPKGLLDGSRIRVAER